MILQYIATYGLDRAAGYPYVSGGGSAEDHFDVLGEVGHESPLHI